MVRILREFSAQSIGSGHISPGASPVRAKGITLIELMVIMTVMIALTGIAIGSYYYNVSYARKVKAKTQLKEYYQALRQFYKKNGVFPGSLEELVHAGYIKEVTPNPWGLPVIMDTEGGYLFTYEKAINDAGDSITIDHLRKGTYGTMFVEKRRYKTAAYEGSFHGGSLDPNLWSRSGSVRIDNGIYIDSYQSSASVSYIPDLPSMCTILMAMEVPSGKSAVGGVTCGFTFQKVCDDGTFSYQLGSATLNIPVTRSGSAGLTTDTVPEGRDMIRIIKRGNFADIQLKIESVHDDFTTVQEGAACGDNPLMLFGKASGDAEHVVPVLFSQVRIAAGAGQIAKDD